MTNTLRPPRTGEENNEAGNNFRQHEYSVRSTPCGQSSPFRAQDVIEERTTAVFQSGFKSSSSETGRKIKKQKHNGWFKVLYKLLTKITMKRVHMCCFTVRPPCMMLAVPSRFISRHACASHRAGPQQLAFRPAQGIATSRA